MKAPTIANAIPTKITLIFAEPSFFNLYSSIFVLLAGSIAFAIITFPAFLAGIIEIAVVIIIPTKRERIIVLGRMMKLITKYPVLIIFRSLKIRFSNGGPAKVAIAVPIKVPTIAIRNPEIKTILKVKNFFAPNTRRTPNSRTLSSTEAERIELIKIPVISILKKVINEKVISIIIV